MFVLFVCESLCSYIIDYPVFPINKPTILSAKKTMFCQLILAYDDSEGIMTHFLQLVALLQQDTKFYYLSASTPHCKLLLRGLRKITILFRSDY